MLTEICEHEWRSIYSQITCGPHVRGETFETPDMIGSIVATPSGRIKLVNMTGLFDFNKDVQYYFVHMESDIFAKNEMGVKN